jgi:hypothetical protein
LFVVILLSRQLEQASCTRDTEVRRKEREAEKAEKAASHTGLDTLEGGGGLDPNKTTAIKMGLLLYSLYIRIGINTEETPREAGDHSRNSDRPD